MIPALLMTTSSWPSSRSDASRKAEKEPRSVTSSERATLPPPSSAAVCSASAKSRSPIATRQPLRTSAVAVALPIPRAPPVIATTLPLRDCRCGDAGLGVGLVRGLLRHVGADDLHAVGVLGEGRAEIGDHRLTGDLDRAVAEAVLFDIALGGDDRAGRAVGGR